MNNEPHDYSTLAIQGSNLKHGGNVYATAKKLNLLPSEIIDASASLVPFDPPQILIDSIKAKLKILAFNINQKKICNYPIIFTQDKIVNAYADGKSIIMTQGMVDYARDDNEIAMVIAHELAHNDRGHLDAKKKNTLIMGSIGFILDLMTIYYSGGTAGGDAQNTELWSKIGSQAYSVEFEKDADYGGVYYAYRAGYDISQVKNFWERIGSENPKQIAISSTHPATAERYLQIEKTVEEIKKKPISKLNITWIGDSNNVLNSLIAASIKFSFKLSIGCPTKYQPSKIIMNYIKSNNNKIRILHDPKKAAKGADVIFSDKVISMNDKVNKSKKLKQFKKFKINKKLMSFAKKNCIFLHCLPRGKEVEEDVFLSKKSKVWQQALNRVHVQKSILLYCFGKLR